LLNQIILSSAKLAVVFCLLARPDYDAPGWKLVETARENLKEKFTELPLNPLTENDGRLLVSNLLEIESLPEKVRSVILEKAEGNPFFVEEVIRMLIDHNAIIYKNNRWQAQKEIETTEIPDNLQSLLLARIDRLPEEAKRTLRIASVIGRQFSARVLEQVMDKLSNTK
jgi:predicted ATPase